MLDDDTKMELGCFCQEVLHHPLFSIITSQFETAMCQQILSTKPQEVKTRESIYQTFQGSIEFVEFMKSLVQEAGHIQTSRAIQDEDALQEESDCY